MKEFHKRHLPHIQPLGGTFFVTYNLYGSIPNEIIAQWRVETNTQKEVIMKNSQDISGDLDKLARLDFAKKDKFLDTYTGGNHYLKSETLAKIVADTLHYWDGKRLELYAYTIMSNHVHTVFRLFDKYEIAKPFYLEQIMHSIKLYSASQCNKLIGIEGQFWQEESYDRLIRDNEEMKRILQYTVYNPVKAGLCANPKDWKWTYIKPVYNDIM
jgi:putative transposase